MSNLVKIQKELSLNKSVFIYDDFNEVVCKMIPESGIVKTFVKFKGKKEYEIDSKSELIMEIELGGELIEEKFYNEY